mmetsp:Transcript_39711/g.63718  ORF Transcript_39711/g.63718 Transcript_39711/m.63718 type:complete len:241 (+) Transcript_39711:1413-2135(+)
MTATHHFHLGRFERPSYASRRKRGGMQQVGTRARSCVRERPRVSATRGRRRDVLDRGERLVLGHRLLHLHLDAGGEVLHRSKNAAKELQAEVLRLDHCIGLLLHRRCCCCCCCVLLRRQNIEDRYAKSWHFCSEVQGVRAITIIAPAILRRFSSCKPLLSSSEPTHCLDSLIADALQCAPRQNIAGNFSPETVLHTSAFHACRHVNADPRYDLPGEGVMHRSRRAAAFFKRGEEMLGVHR